MFHVKPLHANAQAPARASELAAGYDLCCLEAFSIPPGGHAAVGTGLAVQVPEGTYGRIAPRSGLAVRHGIAVLAGVIDRDYTGELRVVLHNTSETTFEAGAGTRIAQLILERCSTPPVTIVDELPSTTRGSGGFGSTGSTGWTLTANLETRILAGADVVPPHGKNTIVGRNV
jgi:dUTP pyrophosphatase